MPSWTVNQEALEALAADVGIEKPIQVTIEEVPPHVNGRQATFDDHHRIKLSERINAEQAQKTLCHELWHCHQREQYDNPFDATLAYWSAHDEHGYDDNPFETTANEFAAAVAPLFPLIESAELAEAA